MGIVFVRLMRDAGFDFLHYDPLCENIFAQGFEAELTGRSGYTLVTAFEVFEHLVSPLDDIANMLKFGRSIFFSTELHPVPPLSLEQWSY